MFESTVKTLVRRVCPALLSVTMLAGSISPTTAMAHGPCGCSFPEVGESGTKVRARTPAYKVVFNPRRSDYTLPPDGLVSAHRPDVPTTTVLSRPRRDPVRRAIFRVPDAAPPGVYLVLIFDGSEGGVHYTWDYFHVAGPALEREQAARGQASGEGPGDEAGGVDTSAVLMGGAGGVLLGLGAGTLVRRRRTS